MTSTVGLTGTTAPPERSRRILRFTRAERLVHRATAGLMLLCVGAAACLYLQPLAELVGRRHLVVVVHEWSGILLPAPFLLGLASSAFRADLRRLNRLARYDKEWLRAVRKGWTSPAERPAGKFNAGQKIYAGWIAGAVPIMMVTGLLMWFTGLLPVISRTSAIFVHDVTALAIGLVLIGHMRMAYRDPHARRGMRTGYVERAWAKRWHSKWLEEDHTAGSRPSQH
ncbi:cytochrome b/b6 domain-containing protein [Planotetraspora sp. A-T 1434]|uniref:cytochrome b/b6 domain-containing protein n=1 Tax=Planotetraspora sp. A-T 1434 TaxID=2979219 RepID=UPI0021BED5DC|nr:cytochrome b/b6 domain-containing protein [Planotetraspora sp. A-T 1434]MCT9930726.1 cytochrome b/b6 domain-containing protein [Planotetraspora sp. A-T 1434]